LTGTLEYEEKNLGIKCQLKLGAVKGKPTDNITGDIIYGNKKIVVSGSYLSNLDFDGERYWDIRENYPIQLIELDNGLPSSSIYRQDRVSLEENKLKEAQENKEKLESLQRADKKLRDKYHKK
jgi:hypothetical protein